MLDTIFFVAAFQNLAWSSGLVPGSGADTWKRKANAKDRKNYLNAQDRKKLQKKIKLERKRSQKLGEKKGAYAPLIF